MSTLCRHFGTCGGCTFQDMPRAVYRDMKREQVVQALSRHGLDEVPIELPADVEPGIAAALAHDGPVLIDAVVNRQELSIPPKITLEMAKGFTLYMVKAVMSGRADEVLDLAVTNLWR